MARADRRVGVKRPARRPSRTVIRRGQEFYTFEQTFLSSWATCFRHFVIEHHVKSEASRRCLRPFAA